MENNDRRDGGKNSRTTTRVEKYNNLNPTGSEHATKDEGGLERATVLHAFLRGIGHGPRSSLRSTN